jgi:hypothetical protein
MTNHRSKLFIACLTAISLCAFVDDGQAQPKGRRNSSSGGKNLGTVPNFWSGNNNNSSNNNNNNSNNNLWGGNNNNNNSRNNSGNRRGGSSNSNNSNNNPWQATFKTQPGRVNNNQSGQKNYEVDQFGRRVLGRFPEMSIQGKAKANASNNRSGRGGSNDSSDNNPWAQLFGGGSSKSRDRDDDHDYYRSGNRRRWYDDSYDRGNYRESYPSTQYRGTTSYPSTSSSSYTESTAVVPNDLPPKKKVKLLPNTDPGIASLEPISADTYRLAGDVVRDTAVETLNQLVLDLGPAAEDPQVRRRIEELTAKIENGRVISEDDVNKVVQAAVDSGKLQDANGNIPVSKQDLLNESLDKLVGLSESLHILNTPFPANGTIPDMPTGTIYVVSCPPIDDGQMLVLPGGDVLCGTGGEGDFDTYTTYASDLFGVQMGFGEPLPDGILSPEDMLSSGVLVLNPIDNTGSVSVTYSSRSYTLKPGGEEYFSQAGQTARFDRGKGKGQARYKLTDGTFVFTATDKGWELFKQSFSMTIDNSANENVFRYVVDGEQHQIAAGRTMSHESKYPLLVQFDRGRGSETSKDIILSDATLVVAVNPQDGLWDLYAAENFPEYEGGDTLAHTNSSAQAALLRERDKLSAVGKRQRFSAMTPARERPGRSSRRSWEMLQATINSELASPVPPQQDGVAESLPMPLGE